MGARTPEASSSGGSSVKKRLFLRGRSLISEALIVGLMASQCKNKRGDLPSKRDRDMLVTWSFGSTEEALTELYETTEESLRLWPLSKDLLNCRSYLDHVSSLYHQNWKDRQRIIGTSIWRKTVTCEALQSRRFGQIDSNICSTTHWYPLAL